MHTSMNHLDGNAVAGPMAELLGFDVTATSGQCAGCQAPAVMAETRAYIGGPGLVLRCSTCDHVLIRLVAQEDHTWLDMSGLAYLKVDRTQAAAGWA